MIKKSLFDKLYQLSTCDLTELPDRIPLLPGEDAYLIDHGHTASIQVFYNSRQFALRYINTSEVTLNPFLAQSIEVLPLSPKRVGDLGVLSFRRKHSGPDLRIWMDAWAQIAPYIPLDWWETYLQMWPQVNNEYIEEPATRNFQFNRIKSPRPAQGDRHQLAHDRASDPLKSVSADEMVMITPSEYAKPECKQCHGQGVKRFSQVLKGKRVPTQEFCDCVQRAYLKRHDMEIRVVGLAKEGLSNSVKSN